MGLMYNCFALHHKLWLKLTTTPLHISSFFSFLPSTTAAALSSSRVPISEEHQFKEIIKIRRAFPNAQLRYKSVLQSSQNPWNQGVAYF